MSQALHYSGAISTERRAGTLMKVPADMRNEGGVLVATMADFLGNDEATGVKVGVEGDYTDELTIVADSTAWPNTRVTLDLDTAEEMARDILVKVAAKRAGL